MSFTVVSWNLDHWRRNPQQRVATWRYLSDALDVDVALVQESGPPPESLEAVGDSKPVTVDRGGRCLSPSVIGRLLEEISGALSGFSCGGYRVRVTVS